MTETWGWHIICFRSRSQSGSYMPGQEERGASVLVWGGTRILEQASARSWALPVILPPLMSSGFAIPSDRLMALGPLWWCVSEVVCILQRGAVSDHYCSPPYLCMLGTGMSLLTWSYLQSCDNPCLKAKGLCVYVCVCVCVVCVCEWLICLSYMPGSPTLTAITVYRCCSGVPSLVIPDLEVSGAAPPQMQAWRRHLKAWLQHIHM